MFKTFIQRGSQTVFHARTKREAAVFAVIAASLPWRPSERRQG